MAIADATTYIGKRYEFKYLLSPHTAAVIERHLCALSRVTADPRSKGGPYIVNSLYFDTQLLGDYRDKDGSFLQRKKLRARMYESTWANISTPVWLEVKHKHNMNIAKQRAQISNVAWRRFSEGYHVHNLPLSDAENDSKKEALSAFRYHYRRGLYSPSAAIRYRRSAYVENFTSLVRISFDKDIVTAVLNFLIDVIDIGTIIKCIKVHYLCIGVFTENKINEI